MFYDTHAHYDDEAFDKDRDVLLPELYRQGITLINDIGCDIPSSQKAISIAEQYPFVYAVVGAWPGNTGDMTEADLETYGQLAQHSKVVAIGEIGLDYHYDDVPRDIQKHWFDRQMALADRLGKPVVIHEREAHGDGLEIVRKWADQVPGVFHCFSGSAEMAQELVRLGWYVSFTGVVTFKNARRALEAIAAVPMERIMIETDCPYLAPVPYRRQAEPFRLCAEGGRENCGNQGAFHRRGSRHYHGKRKTLFPDSHRKRRITMTKLDLAKMIDHTLLKPNATAQQIKTLCDEAKEYHFCSVCVNSGRAVLAKECLSGSDVKLCVVVGFPLGCTVVKAAEAGAMTALGADEIDMVLDVALPKTGIGTL